jgi:hypothetical protein
MKKILFFTCLLGFYAVCFFSCNKDEEFDDCYNLDVNSHTLATRSDMEDGWVVQNEYQIIQKNKTYPKEGDCCYLTVLMEEWIASKPREYFGSNCPENAEAHYYKLRDQFQHQFPNWTAGDSITSTQFMEFAGNKFSGQDIFANSSHDARYYFDNPERCQQVAAIYVQKNEPGQGLVGHMAYFVRYKKGIVIYSGEPFCGNKNNMKVDGENGWKITGVILK